MVTKRSVVTTIFTFDLKVKSLTAPDWEWVFEHPLPFSPRCVCM